MQKQMQILEELDKKGEGGSPEEIAANMDRRVERSDSFPRLHRKPIANNGRGS